MSHYREKIYIVGTGAIGKALAFYLKKAGRNVLLIRGSMDDGSVRTERLRIENDQEYEANIEIRTLKTFETLNGIVVLAIKSFGNEKLAAVLKNKIGTSPVVLLQNGLGIEDSFLANDFPEVYRCVLFVTSQTNGDTTIKFKPVSACPIGIIKGHNSTLEYIVQKLNTLEFRFRSEVNIQEIIWKKVIINSVLNSICPLLEIDNGIFYRCPEALRIARRIISEGVLIAGNEGILLDQEKVELDLLQISRASEGQLMSTLQDIRNKRRTEIDSLNFKIAGMAEKLGQGEITRETKLLGDLIKLKAEINLIRN